MRPIGHAEFSHSRLCFVTFLVFALGCVPQPDPVPVPVGGTVSVTTDAAPGRAAVHGLSELRSALRSHGVTDVRDGELSAARGSTRIVAGLATGPGPAARLRAEMQLAAPAAPGAFLVKWTKRAGQRVLLICGNDDRGLMYGELEVAERVDWNTDPTETFARVTNTTQAPALRDRAL